MIAVLVLSRDAAARLRLESVIAGSRSLRRVAGPPDMPTGRQIAACRPDVVLLDVGDGRLTSMLAEARQAGVPIAVLGGVAPRAMVDRVAARSPVRAALPRQATPVEIVAAIEAVAAGLIAVHPESVGPEPARVPSARFPDAAAGQPLTAREVEVLGMMADGLGNKMIAARLGISAHTAKFHVASIMAKLAAASRTEEVSVGIRRGLIAI